jgi:hypothetical protein
MSRGAPAPGRAAGGQARGVAAGLRAAALVLGAAAGFALAPGARAAGEIIAFPDLVAPQPWPPWMLVRAEPAVSLPRGILGLRGVYEAFTYPDRAAEAADPAQAFLAGGRVDRIGFDAGYGLGAGLTARGRFAFLAGEVPGAEATSGFEDAQLALGFARPLAGGRLRVRAAAGAWLPLGSDATFPAGEDLRAAPFSADATRPFAAGGLTAALTRRDAPVMVHAHGEGAWVDGGPGAGDRSFLPFRERMPFLALGTAPHDRLDLRLALALTSGRAALMIEYERPALLGAGDLLAGGESPQCLSPGFALRVAGVEIGAAADLLLATDDSDTAFDPRLVYPEWALRIRIGPDLVLNHADSDGDGVDDVHDRCPQAAEDRDGFAGGDGCPDPDNDGDRVPDAIDECPEEPEDADGFADADGCPDLDDDDDLIPDRSDDCPRSPEDRDGLEDDDGCPEPGGPAPAPGAGSAPAPGAGSECPPAETTP